MRSSGIFAAEQRHQLLDLARYADADRVADREFVAAHRHQPQADVEHHLGRNAIAERRTERGRDVAAHPDVFPLRRAHDLRKGRQRFVDRHVDVLFREVFGGRGEDGDRVGSRHPRTFVALPVRYQDRIADAGGLADAREDLGGIGHLRNRLRADERRRFDPLQTGLGEQIDIANLVGGRDDGALVLQAVARPHLKDRHAVR